MNAQKLIDWPHPINEYPLKKQGNRWQRRLSAMRASAKNWSLYREIESQIASAREALFNRYDALKN